MCPIFSDLFLVRVLQGNVRISPTFQLHKILRILWHKARKPFTRVSPKNAPMKTWFFLEDFCCLLWLSHMIRPILPKKNPLDVFFSTWKLTNSRKSFKKLALWLYEFVNWKKTSKPKGFTIYITWILLMEEICLTSWYGEHPNFHWILIEGSLEV